jgi:hypothetical protein
MSAMYRVFVKSLALKFPWFYGINRWLVSHRT